MSKTISTTVSTGVTLTAAYDPLSITSTGAVYSGNRSAAVYGNASQPWQIYNAGLVDGSEDFGIELQSGSTVTNTGTIVAGRNNGQAIHIKGADATVTNSGSIVGDSEGVVLTGGGAVANTGTIGGTVNTGVYIGGGAGTITNAGTIGGGAYAVKFEGSFADLMVLDPGAVFQGKVAGGSGSNTLELAAGTAGATGTLSGFGTSFTNFNTIIVDPGANWQFDATDTISKKVTLTDQGTLANAGVIDTGVTLVGGASLANTGTIKDDISLNGAVVGTGGGETVSNTGTIEAGADGIFLEAGGDVFNGAPSTALISAGVGDAVGIIDGVGLVTNAGTLVGASGGVFLGSGGSVGNTGTIEGSAGDAVDIYEGGTVTNSGDIIGGDLGVYLDGGGTVLNAGTIAGDGTAVQFAGSYTDRLIVDPGAVFTGTVQGGSGTNTLELAAGTAGATGTLSGFGTSFTNFGTIIVDSDAKWELDGAVSGTLENAGLLVATVTMDAGGTVSNTGTINAGAASYGITLLAGGTVSNTGQGALIEGSRYGIRAAGEAATIINGGTILGTSGVDGGGIGLYAGGTVTNTGAINGAGNFGIYITGGAATVTNAGSIGGAGGAVYFKGSTTDRVIFDPGAVFQGKVTGGSGSNTLELAAGTAGATGTLSGFGTSFTNFNTIIVDPGANWQFDATDTISKKVTLTDQGTLANAGVIDTEVTLVGGASLANTGTIKDDISLNGAVVGTGGGETVSNTGTIEGGIFLEAGGDVFNGGPSTALISASIGDAVGIIDGVGMVTNAGTLVGGVFLGSGGSVGNTGTIEGVDGVDIYEVGTVTNSGDIIGSDLGMYLDGGGTVLNAGTIVGDSEALQFAGSDTDRLIVDPGAVFTGTAQGGTGSSTLELAAGTAGATGTLSGFGTSFTNFGTIIVDSGAKWQFDNSGTIASGVSLTDGGVFLGNAGAIDTTVTLTARGTFANTGTVEPGSSAKYAVTLQAGGVVTNAGSIIASFPNKGEGVRIDGGAGTLGNSGTIVGGGDGVALTDGGTVTNSGSIGGTGKVGIYIGGASGTVTNTGTISGGTYAVEFHGSGTPGGFADRLIIDPGAAFVGMVEGGGADSTIELASGTAGATGTLSAFGASFTNFGSIVIDGRAKWALDGASPSGQQVTLAGTGDLLALGTPQNFVDAIVGFGLSDKLDLTGLAYSTGATATLSGDTLTVTSGSTTDTFTLDGVPAGTKFQAIDDGAPAHGTLVEEVVCYCRGTRILTPSGEVPVEDLRIGDVVSTLSNGAQPIRWIGQGRVMVPKGHRSAATPVIVRRDALAPGVPHRDLHITKGHALYLHGAFIPAEFLVNHRSIVWDDAAKEVEFYHVELNAHEVMIAEGAPAESYRDEGNRWMFANANPAWDKPGIAPHAPVLTAGAKLDAIWSQLLARSGERLHLPTTADPDLHMLVDGTRVDAVRRENGVFVFPLPASVKSVVIASRAAAQDELGLFRDPRRLGIAVSRIELGCGGAGTLMVGAAGLAGPGFHGYEPAEDCTWTNGHAILPPALLDVAADSLHVHVRHTTHYAVPETQSRRAA